MKYDNDFQELLKKVINCKSNTLSFYEIKDKLLNCKSFRFKIENFSITDQCIMIYILDSDNKTDKNTFNDDFVPPIIVNSSLDFYPELVKFVEQLHLNRNWSEYNQDIGRTTHYFPEENMKEANTLEKEKTKFIETKDKILVFGVKNFILNSLNQEDSFNPIKYDMFMDANFFLQIHINGVKDPVIYYSNEFGFMEIAKLIGAVSEENKEMRTDNTSIISTQKRIFSENTLKNQAINQFLWTLRNSNQSHKLINKLQIDQKHKKVIKKLLKSPETEALLRIVIGQVLHQKSIDIDTAEYQIKRGQDDLLASITGRGMDALVDFAAALFSETDQETEQEFVSEQESVKTDAKTNS